MSTSTRLLIALVLALLLAGVSFLAGDHYRNNAWLAKQAEVERLAREDYQAEVERGDQAAGHFLEELSNQENRYADLETKFKQLQQHASLLVAPSAGQPQAAAADQAAPQKCIQVSLRPELSLGAVWMWNSALAGRDMPAGACGADEATGEACAAGAGLTVNEAWDNHAINAKSCADDRLRHERLIDYLEGRHK